MFTDNIDNSELRQGDIIEGLFYPEVNCSNIQLLGTVLNNEESKKEKQANLVAVTDRKGGLTAQIKVDYGFFILLSQCCDLAKREKGKPNVSAFVASPLLDVPYPISQNKDKLAMLQENSLQSFINYFYVPQHNPLTQDYVVDFNRTVSFPRSQYEFILSQKLLQMTDKFRVTFKLKLGNHFARPTQEERDAKIYP